MAKQQDYTLTSNDYIRSAGIDRVRFQKHFTIGNRMRLYNRFPPAQLYIENYAPQQTEDYEELFSKFGCVY